MNILLTSSLLLLLQDAEARLNRARGLQQSDIPERWDDCLSMTGEECEQHILETLNGDLSNHPIPDLKLKIRPQRSPEQLAETSWMFGVPTNVVGETDCSLNNGNIVFPFVWEGKNGRKYTIPNVPCAGLFADRCCSKVIDTMKRNQIPLTNKDGKSFSCWVHQEPLKPALGPDGNLVYAEHHWDATRQECVELIYTPTEIQAIDEQVQKEVNDLREQISSFLGDTFGAWCNPVKKFEEKMPFYGRSFPRAMSKSAGLFAGQCERDTGYATLTSDQRKDLEFIYKELAEPIHSDENCIIIYTDHTGDKVVRVPQIGGGRNDDMDVDESSIMAQLGCPTGQQPNGFGGCMCPAADNMARNENYWSTFGRNAVEVEGPVEELGNSCECPPGLIEVFGVCYCSGGFKIWDATREECICPHGVESDGACVCPGPFSGLDWNNVGWIKDNKGDSCILDSDCTLAGKNNHQYTYYTYEEGCFNKYGSYDDDGGYNYYY